MPEAYGDILHGQLRNLNLNIPTAVQQKLFRYCQELERWNQRINLTSLSGATLVKRLIIEPVWIGEKLNISGTLADIGSGNGSPAVPLCVTRNLSHAHLIEARTRRAAFLRHVVTTLNIDAEVHRARFEDALGEIPSVDWITLQAVKPTKVLVDAMKRICRPTTSAIWITSPSIELSLGTRVPTPFEDTVAMVFQPAAE